MENDSLITRLFTILAQLLGLINSDKKFSDKEVVIKTCKIHSFFLKDPKVASAIKAQDLQALIKALNSGDKETHSILHAACMEGNFRVVEVLLRLGFNPNVRATYDGETPVSIAVYHERIEILRILLDYGAIPLSRYGNRYTLLHEASERNYPEIIELLIANGRLNPNAQTTGSDYSVNGSTALHVAAYSNNVNAVKVLLENGANPNILDGNNKKAVDYTSDPETIDLLNLVKILPTYEQSQNIQTLPSYEQVVSSNLNFIQVDTNPPFYRNN
jgi:ankyrin repeat protein